MERMDDLFEVIKLVEKENGNVNVDEARASGPWSRPWAGEEGKDGKDERIEDVNGNEK